MALQTLTDTISSHSETVDRGSARVAAIGDLHVRAFPRQQQVNGLPDLRQHADLLVVAGDITDSGLLTELEAAVELLADVRVPVVTVLGNHDLRTLRRTAFRRVLERAGIGVLDGEGAVVTLENGVRIGLAGSSGCGGGFWPYAGPKRFPGRAMKALAVRSKRETGGLDAALSTLDADVRLVLTHFSPTATTLGREPLAKYWMLGNDALGEVIDRHRVDLAIHGHAHLGNPVGVTRGGVPVRNVALPVTNAVTTFVLSPGSPEARRPGSSSDPERPVDNTLAVPLA